MSLNDYCPVQSSINRYCAELGEDDAFDRAVDKRKDDIMNNLTPEIIQEALCEVPDNCCLWRDIADGARVFNKSGHIHLYNADDVLRCLFSAIEAYAEQEALRQIREERDNPPIPPEDEGDDH